MRRDDGGSRGTGRSIARRGVRLGVVLGGLAATVGLAAAQPGAGGAGLPWYAAPAATVGVVLFAGVGLFGFAPEYGHGVLDAAGENPPIAFVYGLGIQVSLFVLAVLLGVLAIVPFIGWILAFAIGVPLLVVAIVASTAGYTLVGRFLVGLVGPSNVWLGLAVGAVLAVVVASLPLLVAAPLGVALTAMGFGGVVRRRLGAGSEDDRTIPDRRL